MSINKFLDLSTAYITEEDSHKLHEKRISLPHVITHKYGYFVHVTLDKAEAANTVLQLTKDGFSKAFIDLYQYAVENECWWINFDMIAEQEEDGRFPVFDW